VSATPTNARRDSMAPVGVEPYRAQAVEKGAALGPASTTRCWA
jgi:hypothetical protein